MKNIFNKTNAPYLAIGTLATLALLASGVFAAAPYIGFLAPVAALSVGLPFVIGGAIFSAVVIALSAVAISKNNAISEKEAQLADEKSKVETKDTIISEKEAIVQAQKQTISGQNDQLSEKDNKIAKKVAIVDSTVQLAKETVNGAVSLTKGAANGILCLGQYVYDNYVPSIEYKKEKLSDAFDAVGNGLRNTYSVMPSVEFAKDIKTASQKAFASVNEAYSSGRVPGIVKRGLTDVCYPPIESAKGTLTSVESGVKSAYDTSVEYVKGKFNSTGNKLKNVYDTMPSAESARNWVPSLKTAGWIAGGAGLLAGATYIAANGGFTVADNSSDAVSNSTNSTESGALISNLPSTCPRLTMQCQIDEASKKLADAEKFAENNFGISEEDNTNNKNEPQSMVSKILSISRNLWGSISNFISGSNKDTHNHSEPQWSKDLHKSEDLEEIMDGGILGNLFSPRVDNGINTSKQQGTFIDSVELKRLTKELSPSAYPNGSPRVI